MNPRRQMQRLLRALEEIHERERILTKAQIGCKSALDRAVREAEALLALVDGPEPFDAERF